MKISRGLNGLLWCLPAHVVATPSDAAPPVIQRSYPRLDIFNMSALNGFFDAYKSDHGVARSRTQPRPSDNGVFSGEQEQGQEQTEEADLGCGGPECSPLEYVTP